MYVYILGVFTFKDDIEHGGDVVHYHEISRCFAIIGYGNNLFGHRHSVSLRRQVLTHIYERDKQTSKGEIRTIVITYCV